MPNDEPLSRSVVRVVSVGKAHSFYQPWELRYQESANGSGVIIDGHRVVTNAHVVNGATFIEVRRSGDPRRYTAHIEGVCHDSEIAILGVEDEVFWKGAVAAEFAPLPHRNAVVVVYGFPRGGNDLCVTSGVVSRIEVREYTYSRRDLLAIQTDASINGGSSGGPAFVDGALIGIAFQSYDDSEIQRTGYIVPSELILRFLEGQRVSRPIGVPDLGVYWQRMDNPALRKWVGVEGTDPGVLITRVIHGASAAGHLRPGDVLTHIGEEEIACDGTVAIENVGERAHFSRVVSSQYIGTKLSVRFVRARAASCADLLLLEHKSLVPLPRRGVPPRYLVFGGIVFVPLTYEYMETWGMKQTHYRFKSLLNDAFPSAERREVVLVSHVLAHEVNVGYHGVSGAVVERVNGMDISSLMDVQRALLCPVDGLHVVEIFYHGPRGIASDPHSTFGTRIVLDAAAVERCSPEILASHGIANGRSETL